MARRRPVRPTVSTALAVIAVLALVGCGSASGPDIPASVTAGLDPEVVAEVLADPGARETLSLDRTDVERHGMVQGMVTNFIVCRDALRVLETWRSTGVRPELAPLPTPQNPDAEIHEWWLTRYADLQDVVASGESDQLVEWIASFDGCGSHVPALPGDVDGPTLADRALAAR